MTVTDYVQWITVKDIGDCHFIELKVILKKSKRIQGVRAALLKNAILELRSRIQGRRIGFGVLNLVTSLQTLEWNCKL